jgi:hypothetical protein
VGPIVGMPRRHVMALHEMRWLHPTLRRLGGAEATLPGEPPRVMGVQGWWLAAALPSPLLRAARRAWRALTAVAGARA